MNQFKENVVNSFRLVKTDIIKLQNTIIELRRSQQDLMQRVYTLEAEKQVRAAARSHANKHFVASKEGKKFHIADCPFAQNIKPKSKLNFKSKIKALNDGYKPCNCVK